MRVLFPLTVLALTSAAHAQCELAELVPSSPSTGFGSKGAAIDASIAAVGGAQWVEVFQQGPGGWTSSARLNAPSGSTNVYPFRIAVDGQRIVTSDPSYGHQQPGRTLVYERQGGSWVLRDELRDSPLPEDRAGWDIDIAGDLVVVGMDKLNLFYNRSEVVWIYQLLPGSGHVSTIYRPTNWNWSGVTEGFGNSVAIEGDWIAIGAPEVGSGWSQLPGRVFMLRRSSGTWIADQHFVPDDVLDGEGFGSKVELAGGRLFVGTWEWASPPRIYVFEHSGGSWVKTQVIVPNFGQSWLSDRFEVNGVNLVLATRGSSTSTGTGRGFELLANLWQPTSIFTAADAPAGGSFVHSLGLSSEHVLLTSSNPGRAWIFELAGGRNYNQCAANPNSTGSPARITLEGSSSIAANEFALRATGAVPGQHGLFFYGRQATQLPFGNGLLCVGGTVWRLLPAQAVDAQGQALRALDFGLPPVGSGPGQILPGVLQLFQFWYRDPAAGGARFNLTDALAVHFCP